MDIAIDCAMAHLNVPGLKLHIRNAVRLGASREVMEVFELASLGRGVGGGNGEGEEKR